MRHGLTMQGEAVCKPVGQLSQGPHRAVPFWHSLGKTAPPFLILEGGNARVEKGRSCPLTSFPNYHRG